MVLSHGACFHCRWPSFSRAVLIPKGRDGPFQVAISRNGHVLVLSDRSLAAHAGEPVFVLVRPWLDRDGGTVIQVRVRPPRRLPALTAEASVASETPTDAFLALPLSPRGVLVFQQPRNPDLRGRHPEASFAP